MVDQGRIENVYRLQVMNATEATQTYSIAVSGLEGAVVASETSIEVRSTEVRSVAVRVQVPPGVAPGSHPIHFDVRSTGADVAQVSEKAVFLVPR
jgi:polyferredoxin